MTVPCPDCGKVCKRRGLQVHWHRAHNPNHNYKSRKGMRQRYDENNELKLMHVNVDSQIERLDLDVWGKRASDSQARILARHS